MAANKGKRMVLYVATLSDGRRLTKGSYIVDSDDAWMLVAQDKRHNAHVPRKIASETYDPPLNTYWLPCKRKNIPRYRRRQAK